jgi:hypothetical protein
MNTSQLQNWLQIIGLGGVILSLVFVGFEIQQSRQIAITDVYQQQAALLLDIYAIGAVPEHTFVARRKWFQGEELDAYEIGLLKFDHNPWLTYYENIHFQYAQGMLPDEHWESIRNEIRNRVRIDMYFLEHWESQRGSWSSSFAEEVDKVIQEEAAREP